MLAQVVNEETASVFAFDSQARSHGSDIPESIQTILQALDSGREADLVRRTFTSLIEVLTDLPAVGENGSTEGAIDVVVTALSKVHDKALELALHIEDQVPLLDETPDGPANALLDVSFALRHELRRAFELDIVDLGGERPFESAEGRLVHAHGLLKNCFRQCVVLLAQALDSSLTEREVFADTTSRLKESILLRDALSSLMTSLQWAARKSFPQSAVSAIEPLEIFRREGLPFLMRRDWEMLDAWENDIVAAKDANEFESAVKRTLVGLETLLGQVRMRAVFKDQGTTNKNSLNRGFTWMVAALTSRMSPALWSGAAAALILACALAFFVDTTLEIRGSQFIPAAGAAIVATETVSQKTDRAEVQPKERSEPTRSVKSESANVNTPGQDLTLQVGAFRDNSAALEKAARLKTLGVDLRIVQAQKDGQTIYRVQVGQFSTNAEATTFGRQLLARGLADAFIIIQSGR